MLKQLFSTPAWAEGYNRDLDKLPYFSSREYGRLKGELHTLGIPWTQCIFIELGHDGF